MQKKNSVLIFIFHSFLFFKIYLKENLIDNICPNNGNLIPKKLLMDELPSKKKEKQSKDELNFYFRERNININITNNGLKLRLNFIGIEQSKFQSPNSDFKVIYTIKFYDKEKLGLDYIKTIIDEEPLYQYSLVKIGNETKGVINWAVDINGTDNQYQIVQLLGEASYKNIKEIYLYNSLILKITKEKEKVKKDRTFEFWIILMSYLGIVLITFVGTFVYFYATMNFGRNTIIGGTGLINSVSSQDIENIQRPGRTTA